jgi:hypothetical protein
MDGVATATAVKNELVDRIERSRPASIPSRHAAGGQ